MATQKIEDAWVFKDKQYIEQKDSIRQDSNQEQGRPNIDSSLNQVNEQTLREFARKMKYIHENGWNEEKQPIDNIWAKYESIIKKIFEEDENVMWDINTMSDKEVENAADRAMEDQPNKINEQKKVYMMAIWNASPEDIQKLNEFVNENMADVQNYYNKIINNSKNNSPYEYDQAA